MTGPQPVVLPLHYRAEMAGSAGFEPAELSFGKLATFCDKPDSTNSPKRGTVEPDTFQLHEPKPMIGVEPISLVIELTLYRCSPILRHR